MMNSVNWSFENIEFKDTLEGVPKLLYGEESVSRDTFSMLSLWKELNFLSNIVFRKFLISLKKTTTI